jgi:hypothetical protein
VTSSSDVASCFIGSSSEGLGYARALAALLEDAGIRCEQWNLTTFALGEMTMQSLEHALARNSFAAFIATADDETTSRGHAKLSPRDNIIFEFGLFAGRIGRARTFLLVPDDVPDLKLPSDLLGVTVGNFASRSTRPARLNAMRPAATSIIEAVKRVGPLEAPTDPAIANELLMSVSRQLAELRGTVNIRMNAASRRGWERAVLAAVLEPFLARSDDAYSAWLRPASPDGDTLEPVASTNLAQSDPGAHHWKSGEGLAGKVWETGQQASVDALHPHRWFTKRPGCDNETYICVPIGKPGGPEGVLAVGSDEGFDVRAGDFGLLHAYGKLLALAMPRS